MGRSSPTVPSAMVWIALVAAPALWLAAHRVDQATAAGSDRGFTLLAGATGLLRGHYPVTQRPPLYSAALAGLGALLGVDPAVTTPAARELGNRQRLEVAQGFREPRFLRAVLWIQLALFGATAAALAGILQLAEVGRGTTAAGVALFVLASCGAPVAAVHDAILTQLLLAGAVLALAVALGRGPAAGPWLVAGVLLALAALNRAAFLLVAPVMALSLWRPQVGPRRAALLLAPALLLVGAWSLRNYFRHGFFGLSAQLGVSLGTRTSLYLERITPVYPQEAPVFLAFRNRLLVESPEHTGILWADEACRWLMEERGLTYVEANRFLARLNTAAIARAPLRYLFEVAKSLLAFHWPETPAWPPAVRLPLAAAELLISALMLAATAVWLSGRLLRRDSGSPADPILLAALSLFWYAALVSSAVDVGRPEHRVPVQFTAPLVIVLVWRRVKSWRQSTPSC